MQWTKTSDKLPEYGEPVSIKRGFTVQHVTYELIREEEVSPYFRPVYFNYCEDLRIPYGDVKAWMYLPE